MSSRTRRIDDLRTGAAVLFIGLASLALALFGLAWILAAPRGALLPSPLEWLRQLDPDAAANALSNAAEVIAGVLAIAMTVVAIVVELAATRYSHRITFLFIREPVNAAVLGLFLLTTIECLWIATSVPPADAAALVPSAGFVLAMGMVSLSLLVLLPYFALVFSFISPLNVIRRIRTLGTRAIETASPERLPEARANVLEIIDELQDVARSAVEGGDRSIAMACVDALYELVSDYQRLRGGLPEDWADAEELLREDPDFVSFAPSAMAEALPIWVEVKVFRQYLSLVGQAMPRARDVANLIAIRTRAVGTAAAGDNEALLALCIRCFNSYLRSAINARDLRTAYYLMNQYRLLAEDMLQRDRPEVAAAITGHFQFYGLLSHRAGLSFLLEVAAHDIVQICKEANRCHSRVEPEMLALLLELDREIKEESEELSLLGVRRAQLQLAAFLMGAGDEASAKRICLDLRDEDPARVRRIVAELQNEHEPGYHEFTDRGVNFSWLDPELHGFLPTLEQWSTEGPADARA